MGDPTSGHAAAGLAGGPVFCYNNMRMTKGGQPVPTGGPKAGSKANPAPVVKPHKTPVVLSGLGLLLCVASTESPRQPPRGYVLPL